jgi:hypothetical protein
MSSDNPSAREATLVASTFDAVVPPGALERAGRRAAFGSRSSVAIITVGLRVFSPRWRDSWREKPSRTRGQALSRHDGEIHGEKNRRGRVAKRFLATMARFMARSETASYERTAL